MLLLLMKDQKDDIFVLASVLAGEKVMHDNLPICMQGRNRHFGAKPVRRNEVLASRIEV